jgi:TRAP-type C4-dicarboxylate transport system substrate-binding protein
MNASAHRGLALAALVAGAVGAAACGSNGAAEKSGASSDKPVTLTLQIPDDGDPLGLAFGREIQRRTGGSVRVKIGSGYSTLVPANELRLARALESGREDIGYLPARAWSAAGIPAFRALLAPFTVTTDAAAHALASGQIARDVLGALPHDVIGLALVPVESRRVMAVRSLLSPADFRGLRLRIPDDPQTAATLRALGATPVQGLTAREATTELERRRIDGVESAPVNILNNSYYEQVRRLSGYALFPKFEAIVVSRNVWKHLTAAQQSALREAALQTMRSSKAAIAIEERSELGQLCRAGTRIVVPTAQQLGALAAAARSSIAPLRGDKLAARVLDAMAKLPGAGPQPLATPLPGECTGAKPPPEKKTVAKFPEGTYVVKVTPTMFKATGAGLPKFSQTWTLTTRFHDGRWTQLVEPEFPDECPSKARPSFPACGGTYEIDGDELTLRWLQPRGAPETMRWSYFDGVLRFEPVDVADTGERAIIGQPWRRIG